MTRILALDTTSKNASISISNDEDIQLEYNFTSPNRLSASLVPIIEFLLKDSGLKFNDIDVFGIAIGPGLFTGIRIGLSTLKGMIFASRKPVVPVVTLKALAYKCENIEKNNLIIPLIDAKRNEVYMAGYHVSRPRIKEIIPPCLVHIDELKKELGMYSTVEFCFLGSGADVHKESIMKNFEGRKILTRSSFLAPEICKITSREYLLKNYIKDLQQLMPFYIRKPDAEQNVPVMENKDQNRNKKS